MSMKMKLKSIIWSTAVAVFMIAMGNCYAGREVDYKVDLPKGCTVHFKSWGGTLERRQEKVGYALIHSIALPNEKNWMSKSDKDLICFMDDCDNVYVGLRWYAVLEGFKLWKFNINTGKKELVWNLGGIFDVICKFDKETFYYYALYEWSYPRSLHDHEDTFNLLATRLPDGRYHIDYLERRYVR